MSRMLWQAWRLMWLRTKPGRRVTYTLSWSCTYGLLQRRNKWGTGATPVLLVAVDTVSALLSKGFLDMVNWHTQFSSKGASNCLYIAYCRPVCIVLEAWSLLQTAIACQTLCFWPRQAKNTVNTTPLAEEGEGHTVTEPLISQEVARLAPAVRPASNRD